MYDEAEQKRVTRKVRDSSKRFVGNATCRENREWWTKTELAKVRLADSMVGWLVGLVGFFQKVKHKGMGNPHCLHPHTHFTPHHTTPHRRKPLSLSHSFALARVFFQSHLESRFR